MAGPILIFAEHIKGKIADITFEMLGIGRKIADELKVPLHSVVIGKDGEAIAAQLGISDSVFILKNHPIDVPSPDIVSNLLKSLIEQKGYSLVFVGGTNISTGIGPKLSFRANLPYVNFCRNISVQNGKIVFTSQLFGGKILSDISLPNNSGIISIYPGSFPDNAGKSDKKPPIEVLSLPVEETKVVFKEYIEPETGDVDITKQDILVSIGRGIANADNIPMAEELASILGGALCASRPVIDQGWLPLSRQVGKSGMTVKPKLFFALGISGAPEHVEGMKDSGLIVAINTDPNAPIFSVAQYGICADLFDIIPPLIEKLKS
jgi:electron transfer flavoprotein alpha subunit